MKKETGIALLKNQTTIIEINASAIVGGVNNRKPFDQLPVRAQQIAFWRPGCC